MPCALWMVIAQAGFSGIWSLVQETLPWRNFLSNSAGAMVSLTPFEKSTKGSCGWALPHCLR